MDSSEALTRLAYNEAIRCVSEQQTALESIRGRAATNIGIVSLAASFLASSVIDSSYDSETVVALLSIAVFCFLVSIGLSVWLLHSVSGWVFNQSPLQILDDYPGSAIADVYRALASFFQESIDNNETLLKARFRAMNWAFSLTAVMVFCAVGVVGLDTGV